jgi:hypothetical protein
MDLPHHAVKDDLHQHKPKETSRQDGVQRDHRCGNVCMYFNYIVVGVQVVELNQICQH